MATLQELRKKLKAVRSTEKLTKAMKTVSSAKYSSLNRMFGRYSEYSEKCFGVYEKYADEINSFFPAADPAAPPALFVFSSSKGLCGGFNTEILNFARSFLGTLPENTLVFPCSKKSLSFFNEQKAAIGGSFVFSETPCESEAADFLEEILKMREEGKIGTVYAVFPRYRNVMIQTPVSTVLFSEEKKSENKEENEPLFIPDRKTVMKSISKKVLSASVFGIIAQTALGTQAATLTAMRSAYDTATAYAAQLEIQINRKRQSEVTADVLETSRS